MNAAVGTGGTSPQPLRGFARYPQAIRRDFSSDELRENGRKGGQTGAAGQAHHRKARERAVAAFRQTLFGVRVSLAPEQLAAVEQVAILLAEASWTRGYTAGRRAVRRRGERAA